MALLGVTASAVLLKHLVTTVGTVSTPDTADMEIDGTIRLSLRAWFTSLGSFANILSKAAASRELLIYGHGPASNLMNFSTSTTTTGFVDIAIVLSTPLDAAHTFGIEATPRSTATVGILDGVRTPRTAGTVP